MKALVCRAYGSPDTLALEELPTPTAGDGDLLVKIRAASVNAGDWHLVRGSPFMVRLMFGLFKPRHIVLGSSVAGLVEAVGNDVKEFRPGDEVFGDVSDSGFGAFAEFVSAPEKAFAKLPSGLTFEQAAAVPVSATTALNGLRDAGRMREGQHVLVNGASGGVGTFSVQIAKAFGGVVTGVCSTRHVDTVRSLGADHVIDYTKEDFSLRAERYDLIVAVAGNRSMRDYRRLLKPGGICVVIGGSGRQFIQAALLGPWTSMVSDRKIRMLASKANAEDLRYLTPMLEQKKVVPFIDRTYPLQGVPEALRYLEEGHPRGKVVILM